MTDRDRYETLMDELGVRKLRTWQDYASDILKHLHENAEQIQNEVPKSAAQWMDHQPTPQLLNELLVQLESFRPEKRQEVIADIRKHLDLNDLSRWMNIRYATQLAEAGQKSFHIDLKSLKYHDDYLRRGKLPIFYQDVIRYRRDDFNWTFRKIKQPHLFYGPYISLQSGRYLFSIDGELKGSITIKFLRDFGTTITMTTVTKFSETIALDLSEPIENFEIVGEKTEQTEALEIRSIFVEYIPRCS